MGKITLNYFLKAQVICAILFSAALAVARPYKVAIIDTGVDVNHPFLKDSLWRNPGESGLDAFGNNKANNMLDDDENGFVDDVHGFNFASQTADLTDLDGHGTHVAGIIKTYIAQIKPKTKYELIILKYHRPAMTAKEQRQAFLQALKYAVDSKVDFINISAGGKTSSREERDLLERANQEGILVVAAAGNKQPFMKDNLFYPAAYNLPNIISVVATDSNGEILSTSNINRNRHNILTLGHRVYSSLPANQFGFKTGSSQAAAIVTANMLCQDKESKKRFLMSIKKSMEKEEKTYVSISSNIFHKM